MKYVYNKRTSLALGINRELWFASWATTLHGEVLGLGNGSAVD